MKDGSVMGTNLKQLPKHKKQAGVFIDRQVHMCLVSPSSVAIRRDVLIKYGLFDEQLPVCEDYDLWLRLNLKFPFHFIDEALIIKRAGHTDQLSKKFYAMDRYRIESMKKIIINENLNSETKELFLKSISKKLSILTKGANKHKNLDLIKFCEVQHDFLRSFIYN
jgi:GT2 family glycosyltransferase